LDKKALTGYIRVPKPPATINASSTTAIIPANRHILSSITQIHVHLWAKYLSGDYWRRSVLSV